MIIAATTLAVTLWGRYGEAQQTLSMCCRMDNIRSKWTPRCLTDVFKGTLFPPVFAHSLSTKRLEM